VKPRLLAIASHPIQYFVPIYRELTSSGCLETHVAYCRQFGIQQTYDRQFGQHIQWDVNLLEGYEYTFLRSVSPIKNTFNPLHAINPGVIGKVLSQADVIWINGVIYPSNWLAIAAAKAKRIPILMRSEMHPNSLNGKGIKSCLKRSFYRNAFKFIDRAMAIGTQNSQAYLTLGIDESQLTVTPYAVDMRRFQISEKERLTRRIQQRAAWGLKDEDVAVLFLGKLTKRKHPEALLALENSQTASTLALVWVGAGEREGTLRKGAMGLRSATPVFAGFASQTKIPDVLWASDIFVMPSEREPWGLVLNEAMAAGLPAVVSDQVGAAPDLCLEGQTGFIVPAGDNEAFIHAVDKLALDRPLRERMGEAALKHIGGWTPQMAARGIEEAAFAALAR